MAVQRSARTIDEIVAENEWANPDTAWVRSMLAMEEQIVERTLDLHAVMFVPQGEILVVFLANKAVDPVTMAFKSGGPG